MLILKTNILNPVKQNLPVIKKNCFIKIENEKITAISEKPFKSNFTEFKDLSDFVCLPGFIDTHTHVSQYKSMGKFEPDLIEWLKKHILPEEKKSDSEAYATNISEIFYTDCIKYGTTTNLVYTSKSVASTLAACKIARDKNFRSYIGHVLMDKFSRNDNKPFEKIIEEIDYLLDFFKNHYYLDRFVITPRFAVSCSPDLLKKSADFALKHDLIIQTHLSENHKEIKHVLSLFPECENYTQIYESYGLLSKKTILAHCIHLSEKELKVIKHNKCNISHCPDSNFFLKSGVFPYSDISNYNIPLSLGTDIGAGTSLSMVNCMKMAIYMQIDNSFHPGHVFYVATMGGAEVLGLSSEIGSVEEGKFADLIFYKISDIMTKSAPEILNEIIFTKNGSYTDLTILSGKILHSRI